MVVNPRLRPPTASAVPSAMPSSSTGNAHTTSITRERIASIQPR